MLKVAGLSELGKADLEFSTWQAAQAAHLLDLSTSKVASVCPARFTALR